MQLIGENAIDAVVLKHASLSLFKAVFCCFIGVYALRMFEKNSYF